MPYQANNYVNRNRNNNFNFLNPMISDIATLEMRRNKLLAEGFRLIKLAEYEQAQECLCNVQRINRWITELVWKR